MNPPPIRKAIVAGSFYESAPEELIRHIEGCIKPAAIKADAIACIVPHAGYIYSGSVAGQTISSLTVKETVVLFGPNHTGKGRPFSLMASGAWQTPLGTVAIHTALAEAILKGSLYFKEDAEAHRGEHSLEVELPFLQYFKKDFSIVPIAFMTDDTSALIAAGKEIARAIKFCGMEKSALLLASSDMTHYEPQAIAKEKDGAAISSILALDEIKLAETVSKLHISMCGVSPVIALLSAAKELGAKNARLIAYTTSAAVTGDTQSVVGYAGIVIC